MQAEVALNTVTSVLNSNEGLTMSDNFQIQLGIAQLENDGHRKCMINLKRDMKHKKINRDYSKFRSVMPSKGNIRLHGTT